MSHIDNFSVKRLRSFERDKAIEQTRYEKYAKRALAGNASRRLGLDGAEEIPIAIRTPYIVYEQYVRRFSLPGMFALDVCCGTGQYSLTAANSGSHVTIVDIAPHNLWLARLRAERAGLSVKAVVADAERLPFPDMHFDLVTCSGSLSYVDHRQFFCEMRRVLKPGGHFVCVDSLNHNFLYRLNRYLKYLAGMRTRSTLLRMPQMETIALLGNVFGEISVSFYGVFSFLCPILRPIFGATHTAAILDRVDGRLPRFQRFAFKFVAVARKMENLKQRELPNAIAFFSSLGISVSQVL